jgi:hypothetical protein
MTEEMGGAAQEANAAPTKPRGIPSNPVYERVGDTIKLAAHACVQRGMNPHDIIREIATEHGVHLNVGELRLLLASRRIPEPPSSPAS